MDKSKIKHDIEETKTARQCCRGLIIAHIAQMLLIKGYSEPGFLKHLSNHVYCSL